MAFIVLYSTVQGIMYDTVNGIRFDSRHWTRHSVTSDGMCDTRCGTNNGTVSCIWYMECVYI